MPDFFLSLMELRFEGFPYEVILAVAKGAILCMAKRARQILDLLSAKSGLVESIIRCDTDGSTLSVPLAIPSDRQGFLQHTNLVISLSWIGTFEEVKLVCMQLRPSYEELLKIRANVRFTLEFAPCGTALLCVNAKTGLSSYEYASKEFGRLYGTSPRSLKDKGIPVIGDLVPLEDHNRCAPYVAEQMQLLQDWSVIFRIFLRGSFQWRRALAHTTLGDSPDIVQATHISFDYTKQAQGLDSRKADQSADFMLRVFTAAIFDVTFFVDRKLRICQNSSKLENFFNRRDSVRGKPLEVFMGLDEDKAKLREYVGKLCSENSHGGLSSDDSSSSTDRTISHGCLSPALLRVRFALCWNQLTECEIFVSRVSSARTGTQFDTASSCSSDLGGSPTFPELTRSYFVGIRVVNPTASVGQSAAAAPSRLIPHSSLLPDVPEKESQSSIPNKVSSGTRQRHHLIEKDGPFVPSLQRFLQLDFCQSLLPELTETEEANNPGDMHWLVPRYRAAFPLLVQDEILATLPNHLQPVFMSLLQEGNFLECSKLLAMSLEGNLCIWPSSQPLAENADLLHSAFRLFISQVSTLTNHRAVHSLLSLLDSAKSELGTSLGRVGGLITSLEFALVLFTAAIDYPDTFTSHHSLNWLRGTLVESLRVHANTKPILDKPRILPSIYWVCTLWCCVAHELGRDAEGVNLLHEIFGDTKTYCERYPQSTTVRQLQAIICYNLAMEALHRNSIRTCLNWVFELQEIFSSSYITIPCKCTQLIKWAHRLQSAGECREG